MVNFDADISKELVNDNSDRCAAAPNSDNIIGPVATFINLDRQPETVLEVLLRADEFFFHMQSLYPDFAYLEFSTGVP
jgi:hypothetical protein